MKLNANEIAFFFIILLSFMTHLWHYVKQEVNNYGRN